MTEPITIERRPHLADTIILHHAQNEMPRYLSSLRDSKRQNGDLMSMTPRFLAIKWPGYLVTENGQRRYVPTVIEIHLLLERTQESPAQDTWETQIAMRFPLSRGLPD